MTGQATVGVHTQTSTHIHTHTRKHTRTHTHIHTHTHTHTLYDDWCSHPWRAHTRTHMHTDTHTHTHSHTHTHTHTHTNHLCACVCIREQVKPPSAWKVNSVQAYGYTVHSNNIQKSGEVPTGFVFLWVHPDTKEKECMTILSI